MSDNASLIITTSTYEKKFTSSRKKLFLGKWCFDSFFITKDKNVLDYHWDDRSKLFNDFKELELLYEEYLLIVSTELNSIHKTNYNKKFWRIFIGPWLKEIISILYDRYTNIKNLKNISSNTKIKYYQLKINNELFIPNNFEEAHSYYLHDNWNEYIYNLLLNKLDIKNLIKINSNVTFKNYPRKNKIKNNYINFIIKKFFYIYNFLINKNKKLFYLEQLGENINLYFLFKLSIWFKQIPTIWFRKKILLWFVPVILGVIFMISPASIKYRINTLTNLEDANLKIRMALWHGGWLVFKDHPIIGCGFKCIDVVNKNYPDPTGDINRLRGMHNNFIQLAVDTGLFGLISWISIWVVYFMTLYQRFIVMDGDLAYKKDAMGSAAAVMGFLVAGIFETNFYDSEVSMLLYFIMALPFTTNCKKAISK